MSTGKRFKEIRNEKGYSQEKMANILGLKSWQTCKSIESSNQKVSIEIATKVEDEFGINLRWLLTGRGEKYLKANNHVSVQNSNGNVAVHGNVITINTQDYADSDEIKELLELLKQVPKPWIHSILQKLKNHIKAFEEDF